MNHKLRVEILGLVAVASLASFSHIFRIQFTAMHEYAFVASMNEALNVNSSLHHTLIKEKKDKGSGSTGGSGSYAHPCAGTLVGGTCILGDTTPPSIPTNVIATPISCTSVNISWNESFDQSGIVTKYNVYRNGSLLPPPQIIGGTVYTDLNASDATSYAYTVSAVDTYGNVSAQSAPANVTTPGCSFTSWSKRFGGTGADLAYKVAVDQSNGDMVVVGSFQSAFSFGALPQITSAGVEDIFVAKFSSNGTPLWAKGLGGTGVDSATDVAIDANGNVAVTGYFSGTVDFGSGPKTSSGSLDIFVAKLDSAGQYIWSKNFGAVDSDQGNSVAFDMSGNVIVTGLFRWTVNFGCGALTSALFGAPDIFFAKYAANGSCTWAKNFSAPSSDVGYAVAVDSSDNIFLAGTFLGSLNLGGSVLNASGTTSDDFYVAKFSSSSQHLWSKSFGSIGTESAADIAVDSSGNVFATGQFALKVDFGGGLEQAVGQDSYVLKLSGIDGTYSWVKTFTSTNNETGNAIALDRNGNAMVAGYFDGSVDFGGGTLTTAGSADIFVAKFSGSNGTHVWSHRYGASLFEQGLGAAVDLNDNPLFTGYFKGTVDFGNGPLVGNGTAADIFLLTLER